METGHLVANHWPKESTLQTVLRRWDGIHIEDDQTQAYSPIKVNIAVPQKLVTQPCFALILAISEEDGLEYSQIFEKSVDHIKFIEYLEKLRARNPFQRLAIFMDNLRVHKMHVVV